MAFTFPTPPTAPSLNDPSTFSARADATISFLFVDFINALEAITTEDLLQQIGNGTAAAPSIAFTSDHNTGIFRAENDSIGFSAGGDHIVEMAKGHIRTLKTIRVSSPLPESLRIGYNSGAATDHYIGFYRGNSTRVGHVQGLADRMRINHDNGAQLDLLGTGVAQINGHTIYHAGNDGPGSGLDADKLDGLQASQFLRSDTGNTTTGALTLSGTADNSLRVGYNSGAAANHFISFYRGNSTRVGHVQGLADRMRINHDNGAQLDLLGTGVAQINGHTIYHEGNNIPVMLAIPTYTSSEQTYIGGAPITVAHGLGRTPANYQVVLRCKVADIGYAVGDEVQVTGMNDGDGTRGTIAYANTSHIKAYFRHLTPLRPDAVWDTATASHWRVVFYAW